MCKCAGHIDGTDKYVRYRHNCVVHRIGRMHGLR